MRKVALAATRRIVPALLALGGTLVPAIAQTPNGQPPATAVVMMAPIPDSAPKAAAHPVKAGAGPRAKHASAKTATPAKPAVRSAKTMGAKLPAGKPKAGSPANARAVAASATPAPQPSIRPVSAISASVHAYMVQSFAGANKGDWAKARAFASLTGNPAFNTLVEWRYLVESGAGAPFEETDSFLKAHANWPRRDALIAASEKSMPYDADPKAVILWYGDRTPATVTGKIRLGEALLAAGDRDRGAQLIRKGWIEGNLGVIDETQVLQAHSDILREADQRAKLEQLLAKDDLVAAKRQIVRVNAEAQTIASARLQIKANPAAVKTVMASLPDSLRNDAELRFDAARAYRQRKDDDEAAAMLADTPQTGKPLAAADQRWTERHILTRDALKEGKYDLAYRLVSNHGMETGGGFADAEFLAGWIALRFLHKPEWALDHFRALSNGVTLPISKARAHYWLGRSYEALGQTAEAVASYRKSADAHETFYGQLALARIDDAPILALPETAGKPTHTETTAFDADDRVAAIRLLADLGDRERLRLFTIRVASDPSDAKKLEMLAELMIAAGDPAMSVRVAKLASYSGIVLPAQLAPTMALPNYPGAGIAPDSALVLGLTRQESEFDPNAVSVAGARGLMQVMPASAKRTAQAHGLTFRPNDLVAKPQYNMQIGMAAISDYLDYWGGSYVLAIASYNGGTGNVNRWVEANGDPRDPTVDPIDWIELIPFGETRNYVQRVLENVELYRTRLSASKRLNILADLYRPNAPKATVLAYNPAKPGTAPVQTAEPAVPVPPPAPQPVTASGQAVTIP